MRISVVLLTYNAGDKFQRVVDSLKAQKGAGDLEYVAVDSGSTDGTAELLKRAGFCVYAIEKKDFSFGPTREYAFQCSTGDIIVTLSQDVFPADQTYLRTMTEPIASGKADVVQGTVVAPPGDARVFLWDRLGVAYFTSEGRAFIREHGDIGLSCTSLAISRQAWEATGFGDCPYAEDKLIQKRLVEKGFRIVCSRVPVAWHGHAYRFSSLIKRCLNEGLGWRNVGVRYPLHLCFRDLSVGFGRHLPMWWHAVRSGQARSCASVLFFQIRPVCLWVGNRVLRHVLA